MPFLLASQQWKHCCDVILLFGVDIYYYYRVLGIMELCRSVWFCIDFSAFANFRKANIGVFLFVCPSVRSSAWNNSAPNEQIFIKISTWEFFKNLFRKFNFFENLTIIMSTLHEDICSFMVMCRSILPKINVSEKVVVQNKHAIYIQYFFFLKMSLY
jgi:hypothetical protein